MTTTAGSLALQGSIAVRDSQVASRLREAGAVLLAKANLSEWATFRSTRSSSGWSGRGGQCRNPYDLSRNPCGSSSGSAVSVSANGGPAWKTDLLNGDPSGGGSSGPAARAGYPNITVPAGNVRGLPIGISCFGRAWSEPRLLRIAYAFEQSAHARLVPGFREGIL